MASISFAGETFWNDAGTGYGRPDLYREPTKRERRFLRQPGGDGLIVQDLGVAPGRVSFRCGYAVTLSELNSLDSQIHGLAEMGSGTLSLLGKSYSNCVLANVVSPRGPTLENESGTIVEVYYFDLTFQQIK
jgi:hypothetical protein